MVVPVNKVVRVQTTGADVIHSFAVPAFGIKIDAIPGRLNETWFKANRNGIYYGQCSELCGKDHAFMPIAVRVVNDQAYDEPGRSASYQARTPTFIASTASGHGRKAVGQGRRGVKVQRRTSASGKR